MASALVLKLLIDNKRQRVLFAEAGKDSVDFLFYILSLPVATVTRLLNKQKTLGSLVNLYNSVEKLNDSYLQPGQKKDSLLKTVPQGSSVPLLQLNGSVAAAEKKKFYTCGSHKCPLPPNRYLNTFGAVQTYVPDPVLHYTVSHDPDAVCPACKVKMNTEMSFVDPPVDKQKARSSNKGGFVNGEVTYMVMDDLAVMPMSAISSITLLHEFGISDVGVLEEKEVNLGMDEAVKLLNACLQSKTVLTDVFLEKYPSI